MLHWFTEEFAFACYRWRVRIEGTLALALGLAACVRDTRPAELRASRRSAPVVVTIVVDQLAAWIASERWPELPASGGFARLLREGTYARDMRYAHAVCDTAPGHAALYTGETPRESGIVVNDKVDPSSHERRSSLRDPSTQVVTNDGVKEGSTGASLASLHGETLADRLRADKPDAVIVSLSLKDRGALFGGGRAPTASLWLDLGLNRFVTSTAFARALPGWSAAASGPDALARAEARTWLPLDAPWLRTHARTPDAQPGEGDVGGLGTIFPHVLAGAAPPAKALRTSPFADEILFDLALAAVDGTDAKVHPTLLALSLSTNDYIGHVFGPDSWEAWDELARLDASLGRFLAGLDARLGADGYAVLLTADHGVTTMPEATSIAATRPWCASSASSATSPARSPSAVAVDRWNRACGPAGRLFPDALTLELRAAAKAALGEGDFILGVADPYVFLTPAARALDAPKRALLDAATRLALTAHAEVLLVVDARSVPSTCPDDDEVLSLVCRSFGDGAGDYYVVPRAGSFFDPVVVVGKGTSHGTPFLYDRAVPLVVRAPDRVARSVVIEEPVGFGAFAHTAASLLGIAPPMAAAAARDLAGRGRGP